MSVNRKYFDMGKGADTVTTSTADSVFDKAKLNKAIDLLRQQQQAAEDAMIYGTSYIKYTNAASDKATIRDMYNNLQQQYNQQRMSQLAQEYARWQQEKLAQRPMRLYDEDMLKYIDGDQPQPEPYTDPPPAVANSPTCPQCSRLLLRTDATWTANHYYWTCIYHGIWRRLDGKLIPPHPDDSENCGHWTKDGMLWIWERQRWECVGCRNKTEDTEG